MAGFAGQPQPRRFAPSRLLLSPRAASPLRAYAILNYTLGVGQTRLRGVGFAAIRFVTFAAQHIKFLTNNNYYLIVTETIANWCYTNSH